MKTTILAAAVACLAVSSTLAGDYRDHRRHGSDRNHARHHHSRPHVVAPTPPYYSHDLPFDVYRYSESYRRGPCEQFRSERERRACRVGEEYARRRYY